MKCRWNQFWISWRVDDDRPLPRHLQAHVQTCARCAAFYREQTNVRDHLKPVTDDAVSPSPFLKSRILNEIAGEQQVPENSNSWRWIGTSALAVVAVVMMLVLLNPSTETPEPQQAKAPIAREWIEMTAKVTSGESLFSVATDLNQPLQHEMDMVIQNAQAALNSLANDFVPSRLLASKE